MNTRIQKSFFGLIWLLCLGLVASAAPPPYTPITITGKATVCKNSVTAYSKTTAATSGLSYSWTMSTTLGTFSTIYGTSTSVAWVAPGTTTITLQGKTTAGALVEQGSLSITVQPLPQPTITTNYRVGCQTFPDDTAQEHQGPPIDAPLFDADGCPKVCEDSWVTYTASGLTGSTFVWTVSGGTAYPSGSTCLVNWGAVGMGNVSVTEITADSCEGTRSVCIEIIGKPHARFGAMPDTTQTNINVCKGDLIVFVDHSFATSGSPIVNWYWDFGDGTTFSSSASTNPTHAYNAPPNNYQAFLVVKNACNCVDTMWLNINVMDQEGVKIICPSVVCENDTGHYSLENPTSFSCGSYDWSAIGGTITSSMAYGSSIDIVWDNVDADGFGYVIFDASSCGGVCNAPTTVKIPVIKATGTIKGTQYVCANSTYKYTLPAWPGTEYVWSLSSSSYGYLSHTDQPNEIAFHTGSTSGTVTLHCDYMNSLVGCGGSADFTIDILDPDSIVGPTPVCLNSTNTYSLFNSHTGNWTLTAPNGTTTTYSSTTSISPTFSQVGTYSLFVAGTTFCSPPAMHISVLDLPPAPDFIKGPDTTCLNVPYTFSAGNALPGTVFNWTVTGGAVVGAASGKTVTVKFTSGTGPYSVTVKRALTQSPYCEGPSITKTLYKPAISINITGKDTVCPNSVWAYNAGYAFGEAYEWSIANSTHGSIDVNKNQNVNVTWNNQTTLTTATLKLKVWRCGIADSQLFNVVIKPAPAMYLSSNDSVCRDAAITVTLYPTLTSATLNWSLPYSAITSAVTITSSTPATPSAAYQDNYTFTDITSGNLVKRIYVDVTNPNGCPGTTRVFRDIVVKPAPVALVTPLGPIGKCIPFSQNLTATLQSGAGATGSLQWYNASGTIGSPCTSPFTACNPLAATNYGSYYVIATGTNTCTNRSNTVQIVNNCPGTGPGTPCTISPEPTFTTTPTETCGHVKVQVTYPSTNYSSGPVFNYPTLAKNVTTSAGTAGSTPGEIECDFDAAGSYDFSFDFTYLDINGNPCTRRTYASALVPVVPNLLYKLTCANSSGFSVEINDNSTYFQGGTMTYAYKLGSGSWTTPSTAISHTFNGVTPSSSPTLYLAVACTLTIGGVTTTSYCTTSRAITIPATLNAAFSASPTTVCANQKSILFTNTSTGATTSWWNFDDGSQTTIPSPTKTYGTAGVYDVKLVVTNGIGCMDSVTHSVLVKSNPLGGSLSVSPSTICENSFASLSYGPSNIFTDIPTLYEWMNDTKLVYSSSSSPFTVSQSGNYWIHVENNDGCWWNTKPPLPLTVVYVPDAIITGDSLQCAGNTFTLYGYAGSASGITYSWTRNSSSVGTTPNLVQTGLSAGTYNYQLTISVTSGGTTCTKTSAVFTVVVNNPPSAPTISFNVTNCIPYTIDITASPSSAGTYNWSNGMSGNPITTYVGGPYKVWYTDLYGCTVSAEDYVAKDPQGYLWIFPTGCYEACPPVTIPGPIIAFANWHYFDATGIILSGSNSKPGPLTLGASGKYGMFLDNGWCTAQIDTLDVTMKQNCTNCVGIVSTLTMEYDGLCRVFPYFAFTNTTGAPATYVITSNIGTMAPPNNSGTIPTGTSGFSDRWIPPGGFFAGNVTFTVTVTLPDGSTCIATFTRYVSCPHGGPVMRMANTNGKSTLRVAPNPATNGTIVNYRYSADANGTPRSLELYDVLGRRIAVYDAGEDAGGLWNLSLSEVPAGTYQIVMKERGSVLATTRLSVTH